MSDPAGSEINAHDGKVSRRLVPFLMLCYFVAYVDRVNVGFAALTHEQGSGLHRDRLRHRRPASSSSAISCSKCPATSVANFGVRRWIIRIMFTWGMIAAAKAFVTGEKSFYVVRFVLGVAEAGFFPGIMFFLTLWFPSAYRGIIGLFMFAIPSPPSSARRSPG